MLNYRCNEGYQAFGVMTSRCLATGKWSRVRGKCARKFLLLYYAMFGKGNLLYYSQDDPCALKTGILKVKRQHKTVPNT